MIELILLLCLLIIIIIILATWVNAWAGEHIDDFYLMSMIYILSIVIAVLLIVSIIGYFDMGTMVPKIK